MEEITAIYQRMREAFAERAGFEPGDSCDAMVRLYALSAQLQALLSQADWVLEQSFPQTATGTYLDDHAHTRALERRRATSATGTLRFFAGANAPADYEIPVNTVCMNEAGCRFCTTSAAVLRAGEPYVDVPARAVEPGEAGNAIAGAVTVLSALPTGIVACTNPEAFSGGSDAETDEALRERILESYRRLPNGANAAFYEQTAMIFGVEGVANCHLLTPASDVAIGPTELPVLCAVTWSEIED